MTTSATTVTPPPITAGISHGMEDMKSVGVSVVGGDSAVGAEVGKEDHYIRLIHYTLFTICTLLLCSL